jgi:hypothetical protein
MFLRLREPAVGLRVDTEETEGLFVKMTAEGVRSNVSRTI